MSMTNTQASNDGTQKPKSQWGHYLEDQSIKTEVSPLVDMQSEKGKSFK